MTTDLIIICATVLLLAAIFVVHAERARLAAPVEPAETHHGPKIGARVLVHKLDGQGLQGEVVASDRAGLVLEKVDVISDGKPTSTGGRWHIGSERIDAVQEL